MSEQAKGEAVEETRKVGLLGIGRSIQQKILVIFVLLGLGLAAGTYAVLRLSVFPAFEDLEDEQGLADLSMVEKVLEGQLQSLKVFALEYAWWDETYESILESESFAAFINEHLTPAYWSQIDVDAMLVFDREGKLAFGDHYLPPGSEGLSLEARLGPLPRAGHPLVTHESAGSSVLGFLSTPSGIALVVSYPILRSDESGPVRGSLMVWRILTPERVNQISTVAGVNVTIYSVADPSLPEPPAGAMHELDGPAARRTTERSGDRMYTRGLLRDVFGEPIAVVETQTHRRLSAIGAETVSTALMFVSLAIVLFIVVAWWLLRQLIVGPIFALKSHVMAIRETGDLSATISDGRRDEIGTLAVEFDTLTTTLGETQRQLEQARDDAEASSRAKSGFLATMSHEIRTPMNGVIGMTETLLRTELSERQRSLASTVKSSGQLLLNIINDILDFSKISAGKILIEKRAFSVRQLVEEVDSIMAESAQTKGIEFQCLVDSTLPDRVMADDRRVQQVLINLIANAIKFTRHGGVALSVDSPDGEGQRDRDRLMLRFRVSDTGVGIRRESISKIFELFAQADSSTTRKYGGTGLGLAISKQLVETMGGEIGVNSVYGEGSEFHFTVPVGISKPVAAEVSVDQGRAAPPVRIEWENGSGSARGHLPADDERPLCLGVDILVAEDNPVNQELIVMLLEELGACVVLVENGEEALEQLHRRAFDLVIMDCQMPVMDGYTATRRIREMESTAKNGLPLPVLAMTANALTEDRELCIEAGMDAYICKPYEYDDLQRVLKTLLPERRDQVAATALLDREALDQLEALQREGVPGILQRLIDVYLETSPKLVDELARGVSERDAGAVEMSAHSLKSSSARFGARKLASLCLQLEEMGRSAALDDSDEVLQELTAEFSLVCDALSLEKSVSGEIESDERTGGMMIGKAAPAIDDDRGS